MLTGTLITAATFLPVGFAKSNAGEYTFSLPVSLALVISGLSPCCSPRSSATGCCLSTSPTPSTARMVMYDKPFYVRCWLAEWCSDHRQDRVTPR
ncbi:MAG: hypothetical protein U1E47_08680 [Rivihabitans pingtungensis]